MDVPLLSEYNDLEHFLSSSNSSFSSDSISPLYPQPFLNNSNKIVIDKVKKGDNECHGLNLMKKISEDSLINLPTQSPLNVVPDSTAQSSLNSSCSFTSDSSCSTCCSSSTTASNTSCSSCSEYKGRYECIIVSGDGGGCSHAKVYSNICDDKEKDTFLKVNQECEQQNEEAVSSEEEYSISESSQKLYALYNETREDFKKLATSTKEKRVETLNLKEDNSDILCSTCSDFTEQYKGIIGSDDKKKSWFSINSQKMYTLTNEVREDFIKTSTSNNENYSQFLKSNEDDAICANALDMHIGYLENLATTNKKSSKNDIKKATNNNELSYLPQSESMDSFFLNDSFDELIKEFDINDDGMLEKSTQKLNTHHASSERKSKVFPCRVCSETFPSFDAANSHCNNKNNATPNVSTASNSSNFKINRHQCPRCSKTFKTGILLARHIRVCNSSPLPNFSKKEQNGILRHCVKSSHNRHIMNVRFENITDTPATLEDFFDAAIPLMTDTLSELYRDNNYSKIAFSLFAVYVKDNNLIGDPQEYSDYFHHISAKAERDVDLEGVRGMLQKQVEDFHDKGTGWRLACVKYIEMNITSRYSISHIVGHGDLFEIPNSLKKKKAIVNITLPKSKEKQCFKYAVLCARHKQQIGINSNRHTAYDRFSQFYNWENITYPVNAEHINSFQRNNDGLYINVFEYDNKTSKIHLACPARIPERKDVINEKMINLLAIPSKDELHYHYCAITNLNRLLNNKAENRRHIWCDRCIQPFNIQNKKKFDEHRRLCFGKKVCAAKMPKENSTVLFKNYENTQRLTHVIYCDTECYLKKVEGPVPGKYDIQHIPCAFGVLLCPEKSSNYPTLPEEYKAFTGPNCIEEGLEYIYKISKDIYNWNEKYTHNPKSLTNDQKNSFKNSTVCFSCNTEFTEKSGKVQDHCHISGEYRGAACSSCNLRMRLNRNKVPIFFHNLKNYDGHLIINSLAKLKEKHQWTELSVIPTSSEKYISIVCKYPVKSYTNKHGIARNILFTLEFKDSALFLPASLDSLIKQLGSDELVFSKKILPPNASIDLIRTKGVFCYEYFDDPYKCFESKLPSQEKFYDSLNQKHCTDEEYKHALNAWNEFGCKSLGDYLHKYLELDVHQLADVFQTFRNLAMKQDNLDPAHYFTLPGFSWDSALKMTGVEIDLLTNYDDYDFVQRGIRGGMTFVNEHHAVVNTPSCPDFYDANLPLHELLYVDANNLYGKALSMPLPLKDFKWLSEDQCSNLDISSLNLEEDVGYLFEVDLSYPEYVQDKSEDLPFAPEAGIVDSKCLTEYMKELYGDLYGSKKYTAFPKLMLTHGDKRRYIVHGLLLQFYLSQGMRLEKVHGALRFTQKSFFEKYISFNSQQRQMAVSEFAKDFYKLKNNSLFGKTMENVMKRINFKLVTNLIELKKFSTKPSFQRSISYSESLSGVSMYPEEVLLNKPIFIGQAVLDLSKLVMYKWRYHVFPNYEEQFNGSIRILGGDTDSFFLSVKNISVYQELLPAMLNDGYLDTSNFSKHHPLYSLEYKANLQCVKDESKGNVFQEFVLLKPKCYSMKYVDEKIPDVKKAKGVRRVTLKNEVNYSDYYKTFARLNKGLCKEQSRISSKNHKISTIYYCKNTLSIWEDKRAWINENQSLPFGNHKLLNRTLPRKVLIPKLIVPAMLDDLQDEENDSVDSDVNDFIKSKSLKRLKTKKQNGNDRKRQNKMLHKMDV